MGQEALRLSPHCLPFVTMHGVSAAISRALLLCAESPPLSPSQGLCSYNCLLSLLRYVFPLYSILTNRLLLLILKRKMLWPSPALLQRPPHFSSPLHRQTFKDFLASLSPFPRLPISFQIGSGFLPQHSTVTAFIKVTYHHIQWSRHPCYLISLISSIHPNGGFFLPWKTFFLKKKMY